ncbi:MAG: potassium channel family protein [Acutalibacteraceae bacterium]
MKSYAVIGLGRFGTRLAENLYKYDQEVLAMDLNEDLVNNVAGNVTRAVTADAKDADVLRTLGVQTCDCAIVAVGTDLASSVLITMNLKNIGVPKIICKAFDETHCEILKKLGADQVVIPEYVVADKLSASLSTPNILESIELSDEYGIIECNPPKSWVGKTIKELGVRARYGISVIAVKNGGRTNISPSADSKVGEGCVLVLLGKYTDLEKIERIK